MKLLLDMNVSVVWIELLHSAKIEVEHWRQVGSSTAPDAAIMAYAATENRVIFTHDLDFGAQLARTQQRKPSVVQLRVKDSEPSLIGTSVIAAIQTTEAALEQGALLVVTPDQFRLRFLPLLRQDT